MAVSEDIVLKVGVETTGAKKGLNKMREEVKNTAKSVNELGGEGGALSKLNNMNTKTIFSISNLAQTFQLASGPSHQFKFVLGQIFDQFTLMGPKGLLIGGAVAGLGMLWKKFTQTGEQVKDLSKEIKTFQMAAAGMAISINAEFASVDAIERIKKQFAAGPLRDFEIRLVKLRSELRLQEKATQSSASSYESLKRVIRSTEDELARLTNNEQAKAPAIQKRLDAQKKLLEQRKNLLDELQPKRKARIELLKEDLRITAAQRPNADKMSENQKRHAPHRKRHNKILSEEVKLKNEIAKPQADGMSQAEREFLSDESMREFGASMREKARRDELAAKKKHDRKMLQEQKKADAKAKKQLRETIAEQQQLHSAAMGFGIGMIQAGGEIMIKGEENIGQQLGAMFLRRTGEMLINDGQARVLMGVAANATAPGSGVGMMAAGAAEIAAGLGMGAASTAITQGISTGGGGGGNGAPMANRAGIASDEAPRTGSAPTMGGATSDGGGPTVINISYGVGGPAPEQTAQAVADALALASRRGIRGRA